MWRRPAFGRNRAVRGGRAAGRAGRLAHRLRAVLATGMAVAGLMLVLAGCQRAPGPEEILQQYLDAWEAQDYAGMYGLLARESRQALGEQDFVERYRRIEQGIERTGLETTLQVPEDFRPSGDTATLTFRARWQTALAGSFEKTYTAELVREEEGWRVRWTPALIFPGLEEGGKVRAESLPARRGGLYDRRGRPLAVDEPARAIGLVPGKMKPGSAERLARALGLQAGEVEARLEQPWVRDDLFVPIATLPASRAERLEKDLLAIPGVLISSSKETARYYPQGSLAAHVTGYVGPITEEELTADRRQAGYGPRDVIGKQGAESAFEEALRGRRGGRIWLERPDGTEAGEVARREPEDGHDVRLALDIDVQRALEKVMEGTRGSAVVLDPGTGEVLALASHPAFDPNRLADGITTAEWRELNEDPGAPLFNKALSAIPPGSTLKPVTAAVALDAGVIRPDTDFGESPERWQKDASWGDYYVKRVPHPPGRVDLIRALVWSDNVYFARVGLALGPERFVAGLERFGLGRQFAFDLPARAGQVAVEGGIRGEIQLADSAYGQGQVLVSPLQLAAIYTAFLNDGDVLRPYLLLEERDAGGRVLRHGERAVLAEAATTPETARVVREALRRVVADRTGTAHALAGLPGWTVAGKTGTAQVQGGEGGARWRWFVAWAAPAGGGKPRYLVAMAVHQQGAGDENAPNPAVARVKQFLGSLPR